MSKSNTSLFTYRNQSVILYLLVYVDDIILIGSHIEAITHLITTLSTNFSLKDLGSLNYFLGIECSQSNTSLVLSQRKYILDLLQKTNMSNCKPITNPMSPSTNLSALNSTSMEDPTLYKSVVSSLQYLLSTGLDLSFAINRVYQYMHAPCVFHWQAIKRILRYLKHTVDYGLHITFFPYPILSAFVDADWAGCLYVR